MAEYVTTSSTSNYFSCTTDSTGKIIEAKSNNIEIPSLKDEYISNIDIEDYLYKDKTVEELQAGYTEDAYSLEYIQAYFCYTDEEQYAAREAALEAEAAKAALGETNTVVGKVTNVTTSGGIAGGTAVNALTQTDDDLFTEININKTTTTTNTTIVTTDNTQVTTTQTVVDTTTIHAVKWTGGFSSGKDSFEEIFDDICIGLNYSNAVMQFMNSSAMSSVTKNLCIGRATCLGEELIGSASNLVTNLYNFPTAIENLKFNSIDDIFNSAETLCDFTYAILGDIEEIYEYGSELYDFVSNFDFEKTWDDICDSCSETYNAVVDLFSASGGLDITGALWDSISNLTITQELYTEYFNITKSISSAWASITSMRAPTNLASCRKLVAQIRTVIRDLKSVKKSVERAKQDIEDIQTTIENQVKATQNLVQSGNYLKMFKMLSTLVAKFIERPTQYAAKYPYNLGYVTQGGHTVELDNTEGKERAHFKHKSGTDIELEPDGDLHIKTKNNFQSVVESDCNLKTTGDFNVITDGKSELYSDVNKMVGKSNNYISAPTVTMNGDSLSISSTLDTMISSGISTTLSSNASTEISSNGIVKISSNTGIELDAPIIIIGEALASAVMVKSNGAIITMGAKELHLSDAISAITGMYTVTAGRIRLTGFINLN